VISRRAVLIGGAGVVAAGVAGVVGVEAGVIPGRTTLHALLGLNGPAGEIPDVAPGPSATGEFTSAARLDTICQWKVSYPPGSAVGDPLSVVIALHGYGNGYSAAFSKLGLDRFQAAAASPFAIASVDCGNTYFHPRASGEDAGAMITEEFLPVLAGQGLLVDSIGLMGWSMGGYGALLLASQLGYPRVAAVAAASPAMWVDGAHSPEGAFDDAEDYARYDLKGNQSALDGVAVRIDCGTGDGFLPVVQSYVEGFDTPPAGGFEPGGHNDDYWRRVAPKQLAFFAQHLGK
jgi:S-formylglutathione hydrolase FrmB